MAAAGALEAGVLVILAKGTASGTEEEDRRLLLLSDGEAGLQWSSKEGSAQHAWDSINWPAMDFKRKLSTASMHICIYIYRIASTSN